MKRGIRQSNIELLRIISMFFVLIVHACFQSTGVPNNIDFHNNEIKTVFEIIFEFIAIPAVNVFILISGYFGIKCKFKSVLNIIYIIFFLRLVLTMCFINPKEANMETILLLIPGYKDWFTSTYMLLLIISPVLNTYVYNVSNSNKVRYLIYYLCVGWITGWGLSVWTEYQDGYGILHFIMLYILGTIIRYYVDSKKINNYNNLNLLISIGLVLCIVINVSLCIASIVISNGTMSETIIRRLMAYNSPIVILMACLILIMFVRISLKSKAINYIAKSSFSVYIIHQFPLIVPIYNNCFNDLYIESVDYLYPIYIIAYCIAIYIFCIIIDQFRVYSYKLIQNICMKRHLFQ